MKKRYSNGDRSLWNYEPYSRFSNRNFSVSSFFPSSRTSNHSASSQSSSPGPEEGGDDGSPLDIGVKTSTSAKSSINEVYDGLNVPRMRIPKLIKSRRLEANDPEIGTIREEFIRSSAPSPMSNHGDDDMNMTFSSAATAQHQDESETKEDDQKKFKKYNFQRYYINN